MTDEPDHPLPAGAEEPRDEGSAEEEHSEWPPRRAVGVGTVPPPDTDDAGERPFDVEPAPAPPARPPARGTERRRRRRRNWLTVAVIAALVLVPLLAVGGWFVWQLDPPGGPGDAVTVEVEPGWGSKEAGDALADLSVIGSSFAFQVWARVSGTNFQAGTYQLQEDMGVRSAANALEAGPGTALADQHRLLLPPGLTLAQIADRVGALPGHDRDTFLGVASSGVVRSRYQPEGVTSLEGLTWPDTYFVGDAQTDHEILQLIVDEFDEHADAAGLANASAIGLTPYEALISASLIQGEASAADAANVSGVIVNRLRQGIPLQIDATLCYAKGGCPPVPNNGDKQLDSPYNTYRVSGLPPTPILTVTDAAMRAAVSPAAHAYLFYVAGDDGVTRFADTLAGHEENIRRFGVRGE